MKFNNLLFTTFLFTTLMNFSPLQGSEIDHDENTSTQISQDFFQTFITCGNQPYDHINAVMSSFDPKHIKDFFQNLEEYFKEQGNEGPLFDQEIKDLEPFAVMSTQIIDTWRKNPILAHYYQGSLQCIQESRANTLTLSDCILPRQRYTDTSMQERAHLLLLLEALDSQDIPPEITPELVFKFAARSKNICAATELIEKYTHDRDIFESFLHLAIQEGATQIFSRLLDEDPDVCRQKDENGSTLFHYACNKGFTSIALTLLDREPNLLLITDDYKNTGLHYACMRGYVETVRLLLFLNNGISDGDISSLFIPNNQGGTVLHHACYYGHTPIVRLLLNLAPELLKVQDLNGNTGLHHACAQKHFETLQMILVQELPDEISSLLLIQNNKRKTALHYACEKGHKRISIALINKAPKLLGIEDYDYKTPLVQALDLKKIRLLRKLKKNNNVQVFLQENKDIEERIEGLLTLTPSLGKRERQNTEDIS